ncbi:TBCC domain-containing protein 1-like [Lineus longissimus]|uniref:TBCC domain-containing protein 1-like n=1 Tax=Lineus longissimus TaxID=88925 RepID=UPI002B4CBF6D
MAYAAVPNASLWVRSEPFTSGVLPVPPHPRLNFHNINKLVLYAKGKGRLGFPKLSYTVWKHIACNKLQLSEDLAWMYFTACDTLSGRTAAEQLDWYSKYHSAKSQSEKDQLKNQTSVELFKFVLLLYIQHLNKISLRSSLISGDEWPLRSRSPSPDIEGRPSTPTGSKNLDEHSHLHFVLQNLTEMLDLLVEPDSYSLGAGAAEKSLSMEAMQGLSFLIEGSLDKNRIVKPLHDIALQQQIQAKCGYSKISETFSVKKLQSWLRSSLGTNPFGVSSCIANGRRLSWPITGEEKEATSGRKGKIATNAHFVTDERLARAGNKLIIMSQVCKQTVVRMSPTLEHSSVKIHRCHQSFIYLLSPLRNVSIEKCRNTTVVLGPVECAVHMNHCDQVTLIAVSNRVSVSHSQLCTFHLLTPTRPLIFSGNDSLIFAPYNTFYGRLEKHMTEVGLAEQPNVWDQPFCVGPDHHDNMALAWEIMQQKDFYMFTVPFEMEGDTKNVPGGVPSRYQKSIKLKEKQVEQWQKMVKEAGLSRDHRKQFQALVESRFQAWLSESGHKRELDGLATASTGSKK